ncbi:DNA polymerase phi-domain-containing protein [Pseudomassariella vexata]|uniref:DNA polymerase phi-domain-containing protein n=1 Tax=Pseudomassariella vexata TaxID=1141098 RepID=A0A1Y2DNI9_9PEZI|nr:DNA polymerase phi-domain-containing protein [Pseudomassariella vexata]ORY60225.1 DNA polymerase phi-domain-containing protein [Pseudomassariella vexata]
MAKRKRGNKTGAGDQPTKRSKSDAAPTVPKLDLAALDKSPFPEKPTTESRKREAQIYELLGSADSQERIAAADALITGLLDSEEVVLGRHLEKRLFRGLASSRNASRLGFSLVLTEILGQLFGPPKNLANSKYSGLDFDKVLGMLTENTQAGFNIPGQEERDFCFGQLFGLQCFVESRILFGDQDSTRWPAVLDMLLQLANKKVWMRSQCAWVIVESLPHMGQERAAETVKKLVDIGLGKTAEGAGIWIKAASCYPQMKLPTKPWSNPLAPKALPDLVNVLKESVKQDDGKDAPVVKGQSSWNPQLHFVWDLILAHFIEQNKPASFKLFWNAVVDDGLFSKNASEAQKFRGFMIFQKFLQGFATAKIVLAKDFFSRNLSKCLVNQAKTEDRYLHRAALKSLKTIETTVETEPTLLIPVLRELLALAYDFDHLTNTKTVEKLLQFVTPDNVKTILNMLREPVSKMTDASIVEHRRFVYTEYVLKMGMQAKLDDSNESSVLELAISELATRAYSKSDEFIPDLSDKTREIFRAKLSSAFARIAKRREEYRYLCDAVLALDPTAVQMSEEIEAERKAALKALKKLLKSAKKSGGGEADSSLGLSLLYAISILQLYDGDPDAISTLQDLKQCSEKLQEADAEASAFLVEILLSLVSRPSGLMRQVTQQVFETFTGQLSADALERLTDPLVAEENIKGQQALFDAEDEDMEDVVGSDESENDEEEDEVSEIGSDVEFVTLNGAEPMEEDDDSNDEAEDNDAEAQELADLDDALAKVLNSHRLDQDNAAESSDESDMSDSDMMALDEKLVEVFKQRAKGSSKKKEKKDAKGTVINFKHRILDFLDIYVKKEALNPLAFNLLLPLLQLIRTTQTKPLANKATEIISNFSKAFKKARSNMEESAVSIETQLGLLQQIHDEASKDAAHAFARAASAASLLVASSLYAADKESVDDVAQLYAELQAKWTKGLLPAKMQASFFFDWVNWSVSHASNAYGPV